MCLLYLSEVVFCFFKVTALLLVRAGPKQVLKDNIGVSCTRPEDFIYRQRVLGWNRKPSSSTLTITSASYYFLILALLLPSILSKVACLTCLNSSPNFPIYFPRYFREHSNILSYPDALLSTPPTPISGPSAYPHPLVIIRIAKQQTS